MPITRLNSGPRMSQAVIHGGLVYTAGQVDDQTPGVSEQTRAVLDKIDGLLQAAGTDKSRIISANIWLSDMAGFSQMNEVWEGWISPQAAPARATVESKLAGPSYKVEIAVIAALPEAGDGVNS